MYVRLDSTVKYNPNVTVLKPDEIRLLASAAIVSFNEENLNDFSSTLYGSRLTTAIDDSHSSVISNETTMHVYKKFNPVLDTSQNIDISYGMALRNDIPELDQIHGINELRTIFSSPFTHNNETVIIEDDGVGGLRLMRPGEDNYTFVKSIGTVNYDTGSVQLVNFSCSKYDGQSIRLYALPSRMDITSSFNDILSIDPSEVTIQVETVRE